MLTVVTGGARSGKSRFAEKLTKNKDGSTAYIATGIPFDEGMKDRIKKHQASRPKEWTTIERYKNFRELLKDPVFEKSENILFDCITVMVSNLMLDSGLDFDLCGIDAVNRLEHEITMQVEELITILKDKNTVMVTNEIGSGIVPSFMMGNYFRDIAGRINQRIADYADEVYVTISGIPLQLK